MSPARADGPDRPQGKAAAAGDGAGPAARDEGGRAALAEALEREARRRAAADAPGAFWRDLSVTGGLGWLVAAPTLAAAALGRLLDLRLGQGGPSAPE
ncbi:hypothetical protein [Oceanicella actignis]|uniref:ATP synthase protein I n=1 Tax=Oceanicella actignis TaxID=1189325 RepID=A0A1M7S9D1_9RHOB|nr:hypothetical protein [Oceanicella actignis]TYO91608.1 ATP synthase protein I [Oceanicella actignis]SET31115.1 ATP synthase protein I [Oceanicella actignis]SHN55053.1 ATP synthase protein I [Oceanicella actignis]